MDGRRGPRAGVGVGADGQSRRPSRMLSSASIGKSGAAGLSRRAMLAGLAAGLVVPLAAPGLLRAAEAEALTAILGRSGLGRETGFAVADLATGEVIEAHQADLDRPPASVVKILTALYAFDVLGPGHRFRTSVVAGRPDGGRVAELALVGGGDPALDTDGLGDLAERLAAAGLVAADRFVVEHGALPALAVTEADQPGHVGYNPAISGINLNFNRVHLAWGPGGDGPALELTAPGQRHSAKVRTIRAELAPGAGMRHSVEGAAEVWRLAPALARGKGSVWLPVRRPPVYAGDVFATLAERRGVALPDAEAVAGGGGRGGVLAARESPALEVLMRGMLRHSTNLTAEVVGLAASRAGGRSAADLAHSAGVMTDWARRRYRLERSAFVNHSGLTVRSSTTARETVRVLLEAERQDLFAMLEERPILDAHGNVARGLGATLRAKTGTMHFLRGLAGYLDGKGRRLGFAIFAADVGARADMQPGALEPPPGARAWLGRARGQENALLRRWATLYAA